MAKFRLNIRLYITAAVTILVIAAVAFYCVQRTAVSYIEDMSFEAGSESLEETYSEVSQTFYEVSTSRWNYLDQLGAYLDLALGNGEDVSKLKKQLESNSYGASSFYLISENGSYVTLDGEKGYIDLGDNLFTLMEDGENIIVDGSLPNRENMLFYAVPTAHNTYNGFKYAAVAFGYDKQAFGESFQVSAYDGTSDAYLVYPSGRIAFSLGEANVPSANILAYLQDNGMSDEELATIKDAISNQTAGTLIATVNGERSYVSYQPVGLQKTVLISLTPAAAVNKAISKVTGFVMWLIIVVAVIVVLLVAALIIFMLRRSIKRRDAALREKELIFSLISQDFDSVYILFRGEEHHVLYVSPNVERLLGITAEEVYANPGVIDQCRCDSEDSLKETLNGLSDLKAGTVFRRECELANRVTGARTLYAFESYRPSGAHGDIIMSVLSDRTAEEETRKEIRDALDVARIANESKSSFLANMSHDIRTPMNAIIGFTTLIENNLDNPEKVSEYTAKIRTSGDHLLSLINDVLDMSKIEAGKTQLELGEVNINDLAQRAADLMEMQAKDKGLSFALRLNTQPAAIVKVDELRLSQILLNILSNAVKYTSPGGDVTFAVDRITGNQEGYVRYRFVISDNGIGMSEEFQKNVFSSFAREERSITSKIQGTGLGMAITKNLVDLMGGSITVESERNVGSVFTVILEFEESTDSSVDMAAEINQHPVGSIEGMKILAAEDNVLNAELLADLLDMEGATYEIVDNGQELVDRFMKMQPGEFDLILTDVQMPVMNGYEATKAIRASQHECAGIPIIAMTANAFSEDVSTALASGMDAHIAKPIDLEEMKRAIGHVLAVRKDNPSGGGYGVSHLPVV